MEALREALGGDWVHLEVCRAILESRAGTGMIGTTYRRGPSRDTLNRRKAGDPF